MFEEPRSVNTELFTGDHSTREGGGGSPSSGGPMMNAANSRGSFIVVHRHTLTRCIVVCEAAGIDPTDIQPQCRLNESSQ